MRIVLLNYLFTILMEPPISEPTPKSDPPELTIDPSPPELPPTILKKIDYYLILQ